MCGATLQAWSGAKHVTRARTRLCVSVYEEWTGEAGEGYGIYVVLVCSDGGAVWQEAKTQGVKEAAMVLIRDRDGGGGGAQAGG